MPYMVMAYAIYDNGLIMAYAIYDKGTERMCCNLKSLILDSLKVNSFYALLEFTAVSFLDKECY